MRSAYALIDSDAFVGLFVETDAHYSYIRQTFEKLAQKETLLATTNLVVTEVASLLSRRVRHEVARRFLTYMRSQQLPIIYADAALHNGAADVFLNQKLEGTSLVDCMNVVVCKQFGIPRIVGFDKFYKRFGIETVGMSGK